MGYFRELPDLEYQSTLDHRTSSDEYVRVKNLFRRVKLREDLQNIFTLFNKYEIPNNYRPEQVAEDLYGKTDLDWVVLISAGITRIRDQWPLSDKYVYQYAEEKYGDLLNEIHHYETTEVLDSQGRLILPSGKIVDEDFNIINPDNPTAYLQSAPIVGISNYEYEVIKNNEKRTIYVLRPTYLQQFLNDFRDIMKYEKSSQYIDKNLVKTENTRNTLP